MNGSILRRKFVAAALWAAATLAATALSWAGTSLVRAEVTSSHPYLSEEEVADLTRVTQKIATPSPIPAAEKPRPSPPVSRPPRQARGTAVRATFTTRGGVVNVVCEGSRIRLESARPHDGFRLEVSDDGPDHVAVVFESRYSRNFLSTVCRDGRPVAERLDRDGFRDRDGIWHYDGDGFRR